MVRFVFLLVTFTYGCALISPEGSKELMEDIKMDQAAQSSGQSAFLGHPKFVKVRAYPQMKGNHITGKHWVLLKTGNENLDLEKMMIDLEGR